MVNQRRVIAAALLVVTGVAAAASPPPLEGTLARARSLAAQHRYQEALNILAPLIDGSLTDQTKWEAAAEAGRAAFHCGRYAQAHEILRRVVEAHPVVLEPALYLEATSYLLGNKEQSYEIFEAVLRSKVTDLYLAVTLPGERSFRSDPRVEELLSEYARPLPVKPDEGRCLGLPLDIRRSEAAEALGLQPSDDASDLTARAGPRLLWVVGFDAGGRIDQCVLYAPNLFKYTPYRLDLVGPLGWTSSPIEALAALGAADTMQTGEDGSMTLTWESERAAVDLVFSRNSGRTDGAATLEIIRLHRPYSGAVNEADSPRNVTVPSIAGNTARQTDPG